MKLGVFSGAVYSFCTWFYKLAFINILWLFFTIAGFVLFGFFPATVAMLATLRQLIRKNEVAIFPTFWSYYKVEFIRSNKLGTIIVAIGLIFYINFIFLQSNQADVPQFIYYSSVIMNCFYFLVICYLLTSYVEFDQDLKTHIKNSILIAIYNPLANLFIIFGFVAVYFVVRFVSGVGIFFSGSTLALVILSSANIAYRKIEHKQTQM